MKFNVGDTFTSGRNCGKVVGYGIDHGKPTYRVIWDGFLGEVSHFIDEADKIWKLVASAPASNSGLHVNNILPSTPADEALTKKMVDDAFYGSGQNAGSVSTSNGLDINTYLTPDRWSVYHPTGQYQEKADGKEKTCSHEIAHYVGFTEAYDYCKKCNVKL